MSALTTLLLLTLGICNLLQSVTEVKLWLKKKEKDFKFGSQESNKFLHIQECLLKMQNFLKIARH